MLQWNVDGDDEGPLVGMRGLQVCEEFVATMEGRANQDAGDDWYSRDLSNVSYNVCLQTIRGLLAQPSTLRSGLHLSRHRAIDDPQAHLQFGTTGALHVPLAFCA